eukprot:gnl/MRDRNA2_/MRDRNA2_57702_c0_seq1.p1 gnl/MRDRNA2_/MRDRNA2_57702_c0~~gnl/MRDRNA2_/MRDRNA2_57702_c0_seq1.p1  ORF type:complete len:162 (+),score=46.91 gnl/MRDRNA2_/MRDRNA2_57702_c0_seq1:140-625(+)
MYCPEKIIALQKDVKAALESSEYQQRMDELASKCYPKKYKYIAELEPMIIEVEAPIFLKHGLLSDISHDAVQRVRVDIMTSIREICAGERDQGNKNSQRVADNANELLHITKQDQYWGPQSPEEICKQLGIDYEKVNEYFTKLAEMQKGGVPGASPFGGAG